jgi:multimeric flavodoxin WrbA
MKSLFDSRGSLEEKHRVAEKLGGFFITTNTQGGGQETTE